MQSNAMATLGDFVDLVRGTTYKGALVGKPGPALLGLGAIRPGGGFRDSDFKTYGGECPPKLMLTPGDLFASLKGATKDGEMIGSVACVPMSVRSGRLTQDTVKLMFRQRDHDFERYVYWMLRTPQYRAYCAGRATGSAVVALSRDDFLAYSFPLPTADRTHCVRLLDSIEQQIALLGQTNTTLESIAQTLFKSWFIDFNPVRAKIEGGRPEAMDAATAALFPAEFEESALGAIPKGWQVSTLATHVFAERGLSYKGAGLCDAGEGMPMHNLNSVLEGGGYKYAGIKHYSGDFKDRHTVNGGEIIVANTEQGHEHRLIGFPAIVPMRYKRAIFSHHIYRIRLKPDSPLTVHTLYFMLMTPSVREQIIGCANGSTVNMLKVAGLEIPQFVCPPNEVAKAFELIAYPLRQRAEANVERINTLTALRDALLPRLISGRIRLTDAQEQLEGIPA